MRSSLCIKRLRTLAFVSAGLICGGTAAASGSSTPSFTSGNSNQVLTVGHAYTYQVSATPTPIFTATGLPPGLTMSSIGVITGTPTTVGTYTATITASNDNVSVQEMGIEANEVVNVSSSTLGNNLNVYAGAISVQFNGVTGVGFCIDPWHWSLNGVQTFNWESLSTGPKMADGMGVSTALEIEQLWDRYYSSTMSNSTAAGLQIAIWDLVTASISAQTGGADWYTLNIGNDYGASAMISFVQTNPSLPAANLAAVTGAGQDYVTLASNVPSTPIATSTQTLPFTVYAVPVVASNSVTIPVGQPYSYTIAATNSPTSYSASSLPSGLSVSTSTGVISGSPSHTGSYTIPLSASNPGGSGSGSLTLNVATAYTLTIGGSPSAGGSATGAGVYAAGTVVTISEASNAGYRTNGWSGTNVGSVSSPSNSTTTITMTSNMSLTASFVQQATLTVNSATGGTTTGAGTYDVGTTVPIVETASTGYRTNGWSGSSGIVSPTSASTSIVLNSSATITPAFVQRVTLAINSATGGTTTGAGTYDVGTTVPIVETASTGYRTNGWSGSSGIVSPTSASTSIVLNSSATITPAFVQRVTLAINSATGGTTTGAGTYDVGTTVPIVETASTGYRTNGWSGSSGIVSPASASTSIVLNSSATISPAFVQQATLTVNSATGGTATGAGTYDVGTTVPIVETASTGYRTNGWSGSSGIVSPASASTSIVLNSSATISPAFVQQAILTVNSATGGTATGAGTYDVGTTVPIVETASTGYRTNGWSGSGSIVSPASASTSIVLNSSATITPAFVQQVTLTVTSGSGGTATGGGSFDIGSTVPIAATPASGYSFADWTGASPASTSAGSTTITLTGNLTVAANFAPLPPSAVINAAATAYTGSPFNVTSTASAPADNLTLHSIEWLSPLGTWTVSSVVASGGTSNRTLGINFPTTGTYTLRAGASDDNGATWVYSPNTQVVVSSGTTTYTLETMAVPSSASLLSWYAPSPVAQRTYQVQHVNP